MIMRRFLNILSVTGSFMIVFAILLLVQELTIGQIPWVRNITLFNTVRLKDVVFIVVAVLVIFKYVEFYIPRRRGSTD